MHSLALGMTESGKTTLLKKLAKLHIDQGYSILVLTPIFEEWPEGTLLFTDQDEFLEVFWASKSCVVIIDEGKRTAARFNTAVEETATTGRHWGHSCYYAAQGASMISPDIRKNCTQLFAFIQGQKDSDTLAEDWAQPELKKIPELMQGEFYLVRRFGKDRKKFIQKLDAFKE